MALGGVRGSIHSHILCLFTLSDLHIFNFQKKFAVCVLPNKILISIILLLLSLLALSTLVTKDVPKNG